MVKKIQIIVMIAFVVVVVLVVGILSIGIPQQAIFAEFPRIDGVLTDTFVEANPLHPMVCLDNEVQFIKDLPITFTVFEGLSRTSGRQTLCFRGLEAGIDYGSPDACCKAFGYDKAALVAGNNDDWGCTDFDIPSSVDISFKGDTVATLTRINPSQTINIAEQANTVIFDDVSNAVATGDIRPYSKCITFTVKASHNYGGLRVNENPVVDRYDNPCDYMPYMNAHESFCSEEEPIDIPDVIIPIDDPEVTLNIFQRIWLFILSLID